MMDATTILVVDDMEINRVILRELFLDECTVLEAENGQQALDQLEARPDIDIVILDIVMPVMDGFEALRRIRESERYANLPVVICTEHAEVDMQVRALDLGSTDFITKPFNARVVRHRVRNLIDMRQMERKIAEQKRAGQLRDILNSIVSPLGLFEFTGSKVRAIYLNQGFFDMFSATAEELQYLFNDMLPSLVPEDAEQLVDLFKQNQEDGTSVDIIYRVPQKDGSVSMHELHALSIRYEHFENSVYLASITDITHQRRTEVALRDTDQRLKSLINAIPGAILTLDVSEALKVTYFNDTVCDILGISRPEFQLRSQEVQSFIYEPDLPMVQQALEAFIDDPNPFGETFRIVTKDQRLRWIRLSGAPIITAEGTLLCNCVCIDVSAEKESELKLEQAFKEMQYRSEHDALTDIWNRETFNSKTHALLSANPEGSYALLAMNIQRFKVINELFGASVGDEVLRTLSRALERMFGSIGTCGRMEADHFMVCIPEKEMDMETIIRRLDKELKIQNSDYRIELFFGIYQVRNGNVAVDQMCDRATMALKTVKGSAVKRFAYYDDTMRKNLLEEQEIIDEMHEALAQGQFVPYFQPIFGFNTLKTVSAEVLVRWKHPVKGMISPGLFVPLFERNGFITNLDFNLWEQACKLLHQWKSEGLPVVPISINISRIDLYHPHLCENILALLQKYDLDISMLKLEITESAYIDDQDVLPAVLRRFRDAGFKILMDDFGSGYSSLNTLKDMPINIMKIDMCFLQQMEDSPRAASILTSVVRMAKWLDMPVVAEGVETKAQLEFLHSIGCDMGQGYYFSRPLPAEDFAKRLMDEGAAPAAAQSGVAGAVDLDLLWNSSTEVNLLFKSMIGGMAVFELVDGKLKVQRVSDAYYHVAGCTPQEVFNPSEGAFGYLEDGGSALILEACQKAAVSNRVEIVDVRSRREDGVTGWLEYRIRHLATVDNCPAFFFIVNDITVQKEAELSHSRSQYGQILRSVFEHIFELNFTENRFSEVFTAGDEPLPPPRSLQDACEFYVQHIHPQDRELFRKTYQADYLRERMQESHNGRVYTCDLRAEDGKGGYMWATRMFIKLDDMEGQEVYLLCGSAVDTSQAEMDAPPNWHLEQQYRKAFFSDTLFVFDVEPKKNRYVLLHQAEDAQERFYPYEHYLRLEDGYFHPDDLEKVRHALSTEHLLRLDAAKTDEAKTQGRIKDRHGQWVWAETTIHLLDVESKESPRFILYTKVVDQQKREEAELRDRAETDSMSLLYNRGAIEARIGQRLSDHQDQAHAFFLFDIDNFKRVNDTLGHAAGDEVIQSIAKVLRQLFRATDLTGRLGGDEFIAFMSYRAGEDDANVRKRAQQAVDAISRIVLPGYSDLWLTVSLGIAISPQDGTTFETLYKNADKALYSVKSKNKNGYALFGDMACEMQSEG